MAYDGLAYVNAHWVIVPKPFHVEGVGDKDEGQEKPHKDKPAGKGRGKKK